jgi:hypothetical protein
VSGAAVASNRNASDELSYIRGCPGGSISKTYDEDLVFLSDIEELPDDGVMNGFGLSAEGRG